MKQNLKPFLTAILVSVVLLIAYPFFDIVNQVVLKGNDPVSVTLSDAASHMKIILPIVFHCVFIWAKRKNTLSGKHR